MTFISESGQLPETTDIPAEQQDLGHRKSGHLKVVPPERSLRDRIRDRCIEVAQRLDKSNPLTRAEMERIARAMLDDLGLPEGYAGWTMVMLASEFWRDQVAAIPPSRRLCLLPHCLRQPDECPAEYDEFGLDCRKCGACEIANLQTTAEDMDYKVLVAEGSPIVLKMIVSGYADAIVGVACLNVLEKAIDKILLAGIPCMAVPLLSSDCCTTSVDEDWVKDMILARQGQPGQQTRTYLHLMRAAANIFKADELERLAARVRSGPRLSEINGQGLGALDPIAATETVAYDFLSKGGKYSRPFITLAVYDALTGAKGTQHDGAVHVEAFPDAVKRVALSIETFHKASLVHDDIEDDDRYRYGNKTLHRKYGTPTAINVGDYMIGMGYRLVSHEARSLGAETAADVLDCLAGAHKKLAEGQGAELVWRDSRDMRLRPIDALKIYALKTAPAFEAALLTGARLAGPADCYVQPFKQFARSLGVAFQILNDLHDWQDDDYNKLMAGGDALAGRPTVLLALALEALPKNGQDELVSLVYDDPRSTPNRINRVRQLYRDAGVFDKAYRLVDKHQERAQAVADEIEPEPLRRLFYYLIDAVLERPSEDSGKPVMLIDPADVPVGVKS